MTIVQQPSRSIRIKKDLHWLKRDSFDATPLHIVTVESMAALRENIARDAVTRCLRDHAKRKADNPPQT